MNEIVTSKGPASEPSRPRRLAVLVFGVVAIVGWQARFVAHHDALDTTYRATASRGLFDVRDFVYSYYYLGLYPVAVGGTMEPRGETPFELLWHTVGAPEFSREGADRFLRAHGPNLIMDMNWTFRAGERGRVFLFLPDVLWKGKVQNPTVQPCHVVVFIFALCALFASFWAIDQVVLGTAMVVLMGSNPFQLYSAYADENVFSWPISLALLVMALHLPLLRDDRVPSPRSLWLVPLLTGVVVATVGTIRTEPTTIIGSAALCYLVVRGGVTWRRRAGAVLVLLAAYGATTAAWDAYFLAKFHQARRVVVALGGRPMPDHYIALRHGAWHNMWTGLGDFDHTYGHNFDDRQAFRAMFQILQRDYHQEIPHLGPTAYFFDDAFWDEKETYAKLGDELPHYYEAIRDDLFAQIRRDPAWYIGILRDRVWRSMAELAPVQLALDPWRKLTLPFHGVLLLPLLLVLIASRSWMRFKLALFTLPVCFTAIAIYSGLGLQYYACYQLVAAAIVLAFPVEALLWWRARRAAGARWADGGITAPAR